MRCVLVLASLGATRFGWAEEAASTGEGESAAPGGEGDHGALAEAFPDATAAELEGLARALGNGERGERDEGEVVGLETVVRDRRPAWTASASVVEGPALRAAPRRSTEDLLRLAPGVLVVQHGTEGKGHQIFLRGFDAAHGTDVEVLVAGLPINVLSQVHGHGYIDLSFVPAEVLERLEVQRGAFDLRQGDLATAGTLRLELGVPEEDRGARFGYEGGLTNRHRVVGLWAPGGEAQHFVAAELVRDDGFGDDRWSRRAAAIGRWDGAAGAGRGPTVVAGLASSAFGSPNAVRVADAQSGAMEIDDGYTPGLEGRASRAFAVVSRRFERGAHSVDAVAGLTASRFALESNYTGWLQEAEHGDFRLQSHDALTGYAAGWWEHRRRLAGRSLRLTAGAEWRGDWFGQQESAIDGATGRPGRLDRHGSGQTHRVTLAVGARWAPLSWLQGDVGLRGDVFVIRFEDLLGGAGERSAVLGAVSPRATLRFPLGRLWTLFAAYGRGFRSPEARSVATAELPGEDVTLDLYRGGEPEVAVADEVEAGVRLAWGDRVEVSVAGFGTFMEHEMVFDHVSGTNLELNGTRRLGADLAVRARPWSWLEARLDVTGVDARFVESGNPVPGAPWLLASFGVTFAHPCGVRAGLSGFYMAPRPLAHGAVGTHQLMVDLSVSYRYRFVEVRVDLSNLLGWDWHEGEYHFASWFDRERPRSAIPVTHVTAGTPFDLRAGVTFWL
jgi:outer membrane receptor protein involved in Fe transport